MTAIGASLPLLPVATRRSVGNARWPAAIGWLYAPGVAVLALGMGIASPALLAAGAAATVGALSAYAVLLALGLSYLLVPMFALAPLPNTNKQGLTPFRSALRAVIRRGRPPAIDPDQWLRKAAGGILVSVYHY